MLNVTKELTALARKLGYEGKAPDTVAKAIDAITSVAGEGSGSSSGGGGVLIVNESNNTLDKTWQEISDAGFSVLHRPENEQLLQIYCAEDEGDYLVNYWTYGMENPNLYIANSPNGYPSLDV